MSVLEVQQLLARLYTDPGLLQEYLDDPAGFSVRYPIGNGDFIGHIDPGQLRLFAASLRSKRAAEVQKLLPLTVSALCNRFEDEFAKHAGVVVPSGERKHLADAMAFCEHLIARNLDQQTLEAAAFELLDFKTRFDLKREGEAPVVARVQPSQRPWLRVKRFGHVLPALTGVVDKTERTNPQRRFVLFARLPGLRGIWYW